MKEGPYQALLSRLVDACRATYAERLVSLVVYGSVARGTWRPDSDVDLLVVARELPSGRMRRVREFERVEEQVEPEIDRLRAQGFDPFLSPIFKAPDEVERGSPLFLDMVTDAQILYDRDGFFAGYLDRLRQRLAALGARRLPWKGSWYWDLKPDYRPGETIEL